MRYLATVSYEGSNYLGFQRQSKGKTIQGEIEKAILKMTKIKHEIHPSGRTDRGVHALEQTFHFDSQLDINVDAWKVGINRRLPKDILILSIDIVDNSFHARYDAHKKTYRYLISKQELSVFDVNYAVYIKNFDINKIIDAPKYLEGTHDFKGFCQFENNKSTIRTIYNLKIEETDKHYIIEISANGFLKYMVRSIVGLLIQIATGKANIDQISKVLNTQDRKYAATTAQPQGLYLVNVDY